MNQKLRFFMLALLCAMLNVAWGGEVTISPTQALNEGGVSPISVTCAKGDGTSNPAISSGQLRLYQAASGKTTGNTITFSSENTITSIVFTFAGDMTADNGVFSEGSYNSTNSTWTGSTNSVTLTVTGTTSGKRIYITQMVVTYANDQPASDKYYVAGSWTNPTWGDGKIQMNKKSDGTYTLTNQELPEGAQFKIVKEAADGGSTTWYGGAADGETYWVTVDNHTDISLLGGDNGKNFLMTIAGTWTFIVDPTGETPKITVDGNWPEWEYYLLGDFNEWETSDSYKLSDAGSLNKPIKKGEKFKIYAKRGNEEKWYGAVSEGDFYVNAEYVNTALSLTTENGGENFYMNLSNKKPYWTLDFNPTNKTLVLSNYLSDIAALPFEFDGGRNDIEGKPGLTTNGLGTDYTSSPKLKFTTANNMVVLHFDERPGILSYDIKGNSFEGTFEVQTSEDGEDYTVLKTYTSISAATTGQHETFDNLGENVRYIKWLYKIKTSGNVALGNIKLEKYEAPQPYTVTITPNDNAEIFVFYNNSENTPIESGDQVLNDSEVLLSVSANEGYMISGVTVTDGEGQAVTLTEVEGEEGTAWTFVMPKSDVTVACTTIKENYEKWVLTPLADLTEDDIFVIVGKKGDESYAMSNNKGTEAPPAAVSVVVIQDKIISTVDNIIQWNVSGNDEDGYTFYPNGNNEIWLYLRNTNNGVRVGNSEDNVTFTLSQEGYLYNGTTKRYVGFYGEDWRCYTSINTNITGETFGFYKLVKPTIKDTPEAINLAYDATSGEIGYSIKNPIENKLLSANTDADWISNIMVEAGKVTFETTVNESVQERTATITLTYAGADDVTVTVVQEGAVDSQFVLTISERATDGKTYFATMAKIGYGNFEVPDGVTVSTVQVTSAGKIERKIIESGSVIPGTEAYLVESVAPGQYNFNPTEGEAVTLGANMLYPTVKGEYTTVPASVGDNSEFTFYKLSLNGNNDSKSVGFYYGVAGGEPFLSKNDNTAFLAVPKSTYNPNPANQGILINPEETDGIQSVATELGNSEAYTLTGVRVQGHLQKGVYIINGRKQVIK
jgi:hypothetical protein